MRRSIPAMLAVLGVALSHDTAWPQTVFGTIEPNEADADAVARGRETPARVFKTADAAVEELAAALRANDEARLDALFGSRARELLSSGDPVADQNDRKTFLRHYDRKHVLRERQPNITMLVVGESEWPFAVPITKHKEGFAFDTAAGMKDVLFRRIGRNERNAIAVCSGYVSAQKEYASTSHDSQPSGLYAQTLRSDPGRQNGLYWETSSGAPESPAGPLLAGAFERGYGEAAGRSTPYHGYLFRMLTAQGPSARDGAKSYIGSDGKQTGGFALIAYPAEYGRTGVKSFIVNHDSVVYEKDLGERTLDIARAMNEFEPNGWRTAL
jgi:hypothetical protein